MSRPCNARVLTSRAHAQPGDRCHAHLTSPSRLLHRRNLTSLPRPRRLRPGRLHTPSSSSATRSPTPATSPTSRRPNTASASLARSPTTPTAVSRTTALTTLPASTQYSGVWIEQLAAMLPSKPLILASLNGGANYAYGFAFTGQGTSNLVLTTTPITLSITVDNIGLQISNYLATHPTIDNKTLFVLWGGANDASSTLLRQPTSPPPSTTRLSTSSSSSKPARLSSSFPTCRPWARRPSSTDRPQLWLSITRPVPITTSSWPRISALSRVTIPSNIFLSSSSMSTPSSIRPSPHRPNSASPTSPTARSNSRSTPTPISSGTTSTPPPTDTTSWPTPPRNSSAPPSAPLLPWGYSRPLTQSLNVPHPISHS